MAYVPVGSLAQNFYGEQPYEFMLTNGDAVEGPTGFWPSEITTEDHRFCQNDAGVWCVLALVADYGGPGDDATVSFYDAQFEFLGAWNTASGGSIGNYACVSSCFDDAGNFYAIGNGPGTGNTLTIYKWAVGNYGAPTNSWSTGLTNQITASIAVSPDGSTIYWGWEDGTNGKVRTWNTGTGTVGSDFKAVEGGGICWGQGLACLRDGSVLVAWRNNNIKRYNAAGTLQNTYNLSGESTNPFYRIAQSQSSDYFWALTYAVDTNFVIYFRTAASTGTLLESISGKSAATSPVFWDGYFAEVMVAYGEVACIPAGNLVAINNGHVKFLDGETGEEFADTGLHIGVFQCDRSGGCVQLATGEFMTAYGSGSSARAFFWTRQFEPVLMDVNTSFSSSLGHPAAACSTDRFFLNTGTGIRRFLEDGTDDGTESTTTGGFDKDYLGVSMDGAYVIQGEISEDKVYKNILGGASSTFLDRSGAGDTNKSNGSGGCLVLQDGAVVTWWFFASDNTDLGFIIQNADGSVRAHVSWNDGAAFNGMVCACRSADASSFWIASFRSGENTVHITKRDASDGSILLGPWIHSGTVGADHFNWPNMVLCELTQSYGSCPIVTPPTPPTTPPAVLVNSDPCCCSSRASGRTEAGRLLPPIGPAWTSFFAGLGAIASAPVVDPDEEWDY